jgi:chemotaxis signal transduction protein
VRLPSRVREFLGLSALRREVVPVYSLRALLGHPLEAERPRWLVVARAAHVALAFEQFDGYLRVAPSAILPASDGSARTHVVAMVRAPDGMRQIASIASLVKTIADRASGAAKEQ